MNTEKLQQYKDALLAEKTEIVAELSRSAMQDPENPDIWLAKGSDINERAADPNDFADNIEEDLTNDGIVENLSTRLMDINDALDKISNGNFGKCEVDGEMIEEGRLEANPAARTCTEHMNERS